MSAGPVLVKGMKRDEAHKLAQSLLESVGLGDRGGAYPIQLSGGQPVSYTHLARRRTIPLYNTNL